MHVIKDPEVAKLFADDTRRRMLHLLVHHEMSTTGLAKALGKSHSSIVHHLSLLKEAGLVEETRSEKVRNMVQPFYRSVGRRFHISYSLSEALADDEDYSAWQEASIQRLVDGLEAFDLHVPEGKEDRIKELIQTCYLREQKAFEESLEQRKKPVKLGRHASMSLVRIISHIKLAQDDEHKKAIEELQELLRLKTNEAETH